MDHDLLLKIYALLERTEETNENTEYDPADDPLVESLISLVKAKGKTSISEDFETPYIHPMITVQKWAAELKQIVSDSLNEYGPRN
ncbi:hypothetical protein [Dyadobacter sp. CY323]|uniref:hypothetical protein n=1 Tax=Dyadobacter sp. CY323 TaxID=2907302 RepID=UPI001F2564B8|nr:hypothetical protein [Dyadobacter sp. CY323]MCE6987845.1 hypothetical protein [Dyadobacter sp. CY323]